MKNLITVLVLGLAFGSLMAREPIDEKGKRSYRQVLPAGRLCPSNFPNGFETL
ncbi:MAG: hypothetical protein U5L96_15395 [Owenweeksia sp.]|nr:hypothetical protein [Owenweeksia sp.]